MSHFPFIYFAFDSKTENTTAFRWMKNEKKKTEEKHTYIQGLGTHTEGI